MSEYNSPDFNSKSDSIEFGPLEEKLKVETSERVASYIDTAKPLLTELAVPTTTFTPDQDGVYHLDTGAYNQSKGISESSPYATKGDIIILHRGDVSISITDYGDTNPNGVSQTRTLRKQGKDFEGASDVYVWHDKDGSVRVESMYGQSSIIEDGFATTSDREVSQIEDEIRSFIPTTEPSENELPAAA